MATDPKKKIKTTSTPSAKAASPKTEKPKASPKTDKPKATAKPERAKPGPKVEKPKATAKPEKAKPGPKVEKPKASPKVEKPKASAKPEKAKPGPKVEKPKASPKVEKPKASAKTEKPKPGPKRAVAKDKDSPAKPRRVTKPRRGSADFEEDPKRRKPLNYAFNTEKDSDEKPKRKPATRKPAASKTSARPSAAKTPREKSYSSPKSNTGSTRSAGKSEKPAAERTYSRTDSRKDTRTDTRTDARTDSRTDSRTDKKYPKSDSKPSYGRKSDTAAPNQASDKTASPGGKKPHRKGSYDPSRKRSLGQKPGGYRDKSAAPARKRPDTGVETIRLNRYIANAGIASRREADELIRTGLVEVNGKTITEMGYQVQPGDVVRYAGEKLNIEKPVYIVLNKPKDYITSGAESETRRSVFQLLRGAGAIRMWPVGKMDRNTTGLLLFTNDDALTKKLTMPRQGIKKIYHVFTDKNVKKEHLDKMVEGVETPEGWLKVSSAAHVIDAKDKKQVGIEVSGGRGRLARMIFEHFDYQVLKLDRVIYGGLTKKDLTRGRWRHLTSQEVTMLKML